MKNEKFLDFYNEELFYLREVGKEFAKENPQVAQYLGIHGDEVQDPFVERLLEGTAFLAARVQQKLTNEQPEVAMQVLGRMAPLWYTPIPSMSIIALEPDLTFPEWDQDLSLKKGSTVIMKDNSLEGEPVIFTTSRDILIQPIIIEQAEYLATPPIYLPESIKNYFNNSLSNISIKFDTKYNLPISKLKMDPFVLTLTGDSVRANQILHNIFADTLQIVIWTKSETKIYSKVLEKSAIKLFGLGADDNCLLEGIGELPGSRLLREYLNFPEKFLSLQIKGVEEFLKSTDNCFQFEMFFVFKNRNLNLIDNVNANNFRLFATPIINLYKKRCDPILIDNTKAEYPVVVDRHNPNLYKIYTITDVIGVLPDGHDVTFSPYHMDSKYEDAESRAGYSIRRRLGYRGEVSLYKNNDLSVEDTFITLSSGSSDVDLNSITSLSLVAYVCQRNLNPKLLQSPVFTLQKSLPIRDIEMLQMPSRPVDIPDIRESWGALEILSNNPLNYTYPKVKNGASVIKDWMYFFANKKDSSQISRIESIDKVRFEHCFTRFFGSGPITWARGVNAKVDILSKNHSDKGGLLFGMLLYYALTEYCELNQKLIMELSIDSSKVLNLE